MNLNRRPLLIAKVGIATVTYTLIASPIACNLPNPPSDPPDAQQQQQSPSNDAAKDAK